MKYIFILILAIVPCKLYPKEIVISMVENAANTTIVKEIMDEAYSRLGIEMKGEYYPARRSIVTSSRGETDGELFRIDGMDKEYPSLIKIPIPVSSSKARCFYLDSLINIEKLEDLKSYKIGIRRGVKYSEDYTKGYNRVVLNSHFELFKALEMQYVDIVVTEELSGLSFISKGNLSSIIVSDSVVINLPLYHYIHKSNQDLEPRITKVLMEMSEEGFIEMVREKYINNLK